MSIKLFSILVVALASSALADVHQYTPTADQYSQAVYPYNQNFNHAFGTKQLEDIDPLTGSLLVVIIELFIFNQTMQNICNFNFS